jgi:hypothetical protein
VVRALSVRKRAFVEAGAAVEASGEARDQSTLSGRSIVQRGPLH